MTGLERNADIVHMCTYAPLFAHVDAWQWRPDMIWFDNLRMMKTPNYYVQQLYAHNVGTNVMPLTWNKKPIAGEENLYASAVLDRNTNTYIVKVANTGKISKDITVTLTGSKKNTKFSIGECVKFQQDNMRAINTLDEPNNLVPQKTTGIVEGNTLKIEAGPQSFGVYKVKIN